MNRCARQAVNALCCTLQASRPFIRQYMAFESAGRARFSCRRPSSVVSRWWLPVDELDFLLLIQAVSRSVQACFCGADELYCSRTQRSRNSGAGGSVPARTRPAELQWSVCCDRCTFRAWMFGRHSEASTRPRPCQVLKRSCNAAGGLGARAYGFRPAVRVSSDARPGFLQHGPARGGHQQGPKCPSLASRAVPKDGPPKSVANPRQYRCARARPHSKRIHQAAINACA